MADSGSGKPNLLTSLPEDALRHIVSLALQLERQETGETRSELGLACKRLWKLYSESRFAGGHKMVVRLTHPPDCQAALHGAVATFAPGVTVLHIIGPGDFFCSTLLAPLGPYVQQVALEGSLANPGLLQLLSAWPALRQLRIEEHAPPGGWLQFASSGGLPEPLRGKVVELKTTAQGVAAVLPQLPRLKSLHALQEESLWSWPPVLPLPDACQVLPLLSALEELELVDFPAILRDSAALDSLVAVLASLPSLQRCSFRTVALQAITPSLAQLSGQLTSLEIECGRHLDDEEVEVANAAFATVWRLHALERLRVSLACERTWPISFPAQPCMRALRMLRLHDCDFPRDTLPPHLFNGDVMPALIELDIDCGIDLEYVLDEEGGAVVNLPPRFTSLTALAMLTLERCALRELPPLLQHMQLRQLSLVGNPIESLPEGPWLQRLEVLDLRQTLVRSRPPQLSEACKVNMPEDCDP